MADTPKPIDTQMSTRCLPAFRVVARHLVELWANSVGRRAAARQIVLRRAAVMSNAAEESADYAESMAAPSEYPATDPPLCSASFSFSRPATPPYSSHLLMTPLAPPYPSVERLPASSILSSAVQAITADTLDLSLPPYASALEPPLPLTADLAAEPTCHLEDAPGDSLQRAAAAAELTEDWTRNTPDWSSSTAYVSTARW